MVWLISLNWWLFWFISCWIFAISVLFWSKRSFRIVFRCFKDLLSASRLLIHFFKHKNHPILEWCVSAHCSKNRTMIYFCCCIYFSSFGFWFCFLLLLEFICFLRALFFVLRHFYNLLIYSLMECNLLSLTCYLTLFYFRYYLVVEFSSVAISALTLGPLFNIITGTSIYSDLNFLHNARLLVLVGVNE